MKQKIAYLFLVNLWIVPIVYSASSEAADSSLENRVARLERMANNPVLLKLSERLADQQQDISRLNDRVDRLTHTLFLLEKKSKKQYLDSDARITALEKTIKVLQTQLKNLSADSDVTHPLSTVPMAKQNAVAIPAEKMVENSQPVKTQSTNKSETPVAVTPAKPVASGQKVPKVKTTVVKTTVQKTLVLSEIKTHPATEAELSAYKKSFNLMKKHQYPEAIKTFTDFKTKFSTSALAPNAGYWAGEAAAVQGKNQEAVKLFSQVVFQYPSSSKAPASLLRWADIETNLGHNDKAKSLYQQILKQYPKNRVAKKAKTRLSHLEGAKS